MTFRLKTYPPVAADLPARDVIAAWGSRKPVEECLQPVGDYLQVGHLFPVNSGRTALYVILKSAFPPGTKIILPGYTCYTVPAAVIKAGMTPVISDSDPRDLGYDLGKLKKTLERHPDVKAIVVCHLFGIGLDIATIRSMVGPDVIIIDDAAQGFGVRIEGRLLGTSGDVGFYSFGRGKNLSLLGGGLIVTDSDAIANKISRFMDEYVARTRVSGSDFIQSLLYNTATKPTIYNIVSRLPGLKLGQSEYRPHFDIAAMPVEKVRLLARIYGRTENLNSRREKIARGYMSRLIILAGVSIPRSTFNHLPGILRFPILINNPARRADILDESRRRGWGLSAMYPTALNAVPELASYADDDLDGAEKIAASIVTLPTHRYIKPFGKAFNVFYRMAGFLR